METKCACGGPWSAEWELLSSDFKTCSYAVQRWFRNFNTAKAKATKTNLQEKKNPQLKIWWKIKDMLKLYQQKLLALIKEKEKLPSFSLSLSSQQSVNCNLLATTVQKLVV